MERERERETNNKKKQKEKIEGVMDSTQKETIEESEVPSDKCHQI